MSAVLTICRGFTAINDETTAEPRRSWRWHCGLCRTSTALAPRLPCDGGISIRGRSRQIRQKLYDCPGELLKSEALQMVTNACEFLTNPCECLTKLTITWFLLSYVHAQHLYIICY